MKTIFPQTIQELSLQEKHRKNLLPMIKMDMMLGKE